MKSSLLAACIFAAPALALRLQTFSDSFCQQAGGLDSLRTVDVAAKGFHALMPHMSVGSIRFQAEEVERVKLVAAEMEKGAYAPPGSAWPSSTGHPTRRAGKRPSWQRRYGLAASRALRIQARGESSAAFQALAEAGAASLRRASMRG
jgi:hypothetical protein